MSGLNGIAKSTPIYIIGNVSYALASLCFIAVGNCLETLFKNTFPARVMNMCIRIATIMVVFETCFNSGLLLQIGSFVRHWNLDQYYAYLAAAAAMMNECFSLVMTLDNVLYTYTLALLSYLSSDHAVFSPTYAKWARTGAIGGLLYIIFMFGSTFSICAIIAVIGYLTMQICFLVVIGMTGKEMLKMEGDLVAKKHKKHKKRNKKNANKALCVC